MTQSDRASLGRRRFLTAAAATLAATALPSRAFAYPERPIRLVVPFSPGGATDVAARLWAEKMRGPLGTVVIENKGGGGGVIGANDVLRSPADGYHFLFGNTSTQVLIPLISEKKPYDPLKDFQAVYLMCNSPTSIVVHQSVPAKNLQELIAYIKANPGKMSYGSAGAGTLTNLAGELFKQLIGAKDIAHIPYKGAAPGVTDLASGHIPMMTPNVGGPLLSFHREGRVRILAINAERRLAAAPDIPTAEEAGLKGMIAANFNGLFAPAGVPKDIIEKLGQLTKEAVAQDDVQKALLKSGFEPIGDSSPASAQKVVADEVARWTPVVQATSFKR
jgi:tripartite-type tricarboxylate transporter receptor subunit TctC